MRWGQKLPKCYAASSLARSGVGLYRRIDGLSQLIGGINPAHMLTEGTNTVHVKPTYGSLAGPRCAPSSSHARRPLSRRIEDGWIDTMAKFRSIMALVQRHS